LVPEGSGHLGDALIASDRSTHRRRAPLWDVTDRAADLCEEAFALFDVVKTRKGKVPGRDSRRAHKARESLHVVAERLQELAGMFGIEHGGILGVGNLVKLGHIPAAGSVLLGLQRAGDAHLVKVGAGGEIEQGGLLVLPTKTPDPHLKLEVLDLAILDYLFDD